MSEDIDRRLFRGDVLSLSKHSYPILDLFGNGILQLNVGDVRWLNEQLIEWLADREPIIVEPPC